MIGKDDMMELLLDACPSFTPQWQKFQNKWQEEADDLPLYLVLGDLARHLIGMLERSETTDLPVVFAAIERLHLEGEQYVRDAATIGLLESLQNLNLHKNGTEPEQFRPFLRSESVRWWDKLYRLWHHGELLTDD